MWWKVETNWWIDGRFVQAEHTMELKYVLGECKTWMPPSGLAVKVSWHRNVISFRGRHNTYSYHVNASVQSVVLEIPPSKKNTIIAFRVRGQTSAKCSHFRVHRKGTLRQCTVPYGSVRYHTVLYRTACIRTNWTHEKVNCCVHASCKSQAAAGDHFTVVIAHIQACIEDRTVPPMMHITGHSNIDCYVTHTVALQFLFRLVSCWNSWMTMMITP